MTDKVTLRDKIKDIRIEPSARVWYNIEKSLDSEQKRTRFPRQPILSIAAAIVFIIVAFFIGMNSREFTRYTPASLEINDQASDLILPNNIYTHQQTQLKYRTDGRLVPNFQELWDHPLVPGNQAGQRF